MLNILTNLGTAVLTAILNIIVIKSWSWLEGKYFNHKYIRVDEAVESLVKSKKIQDCGKVNAMRIST